ncbi:MAG: GntR family transcriptional regulator [Rubrivivax sp.]|nr:GntR family transcriptional regulator [Rubrivivax sp.]
METVASRIYSAVKQQIIDGRYVPGARITEQQVAAEFRSSRTPVREAMRLLVANGFAVFKPNSGTVVRDWSRAQMQEIFDLRVLIESEIAASAAQHITDAELAELMRLQDRIEAHDARTRPGRRRSEGTDGSAEPLESIGPLNREFHRLIARASRNERLAAMLASAIEMPIVQQTFRRYTPAQLQRSFGHHRELIDAFAAHDAAWARSVMSCHIHAARQAMLADLPREQH